MQEQPRFDIFTGSIDTDAMWLEVVPGLEKATNRMTQLGAQVPRNYFIFSANSHAVLAKENFVR